MGDVELGMVERGWPSVGGDTTPDNQQPNRILHRDDGYPGSGL